MGRDQTTAAVVGKAIQGPRPLPAPVQIVFQEVFYVLFVWEFVDRRIDVEELVDPFWRRIFFYPGKGENHEALVKSRRQAVCFQEVHNKLFDSACGQGLASVTKNLQASALFSVTFVEIADVTERLVEIQEVSKTCRRSCPLYLICQAKVQDQTTHVPTPKMQTPAMQKKRMTSEGQAERLRLMQDVGVVEEEGGLLQEGNRALRSKQGKPRVFSREERRRFSRSRRAGPRLQRRGKEKVRRVLATPVGFPSFAIPSSG